MLTGIDPDVSEINTFAILNDPGGLFRIDGYNLMAARPLDFESSRTVDLEILLTDSDFHTVVRTFAIAVRDDNDSAPVFNSPQKVTTPANQREVLVLAASDLDTTGEPITFSIKQGVGDGA